MKYKLEELKKVQDKFMKQYNVMDYANGCGIPDLNKEYEVGLSLMFETQEDMEKFPYKESTFEGYPVYKRVVGVIRAL